MEKKNIIILSVAALALGGLFYYQRKNVKKLVMGLPEKNIKHTPSDKEIKDAFVKLKDNYGDNIAKMVEKIFRAETSHFRSEQFLRAYSAGMLKFGDKFPYGWSRQTGLWALHPELAPDGMLTTYVRVDKTGRGFISYVPKEGYKKFVYLTFPSVYAGLAAVAENVEKRGNAESWNSNNPEEQKKYLSLLNKIKNVYA